MNTAEQLIETVRAQTAKAANRDLSTLERVDLLMPWVSPSSREDLTRIRSDVTTLQAANRHLAIALADAHEEISRLRNARAAA